jgi:RimJ/RimL family protein N-acetyltransferase
MDDFADCASRVGAAAASKVEGKSRMSNSPPTLVTPRLILRPWQPEDWAPFAAMNADPQVMEHFPACLERRRSDEIAAAISRRLVERGFGFWAAELSGVCPFIGFIGLSRPMFQAHFTPCVEIGWRLAREHWGRGYATEGARASLQFAFEQLGLDEVVSFTVPANQRSRRVMERLGMMHDAADDFEHPDVPVGHPIRPHVLYRLRRERWEEALRTRSPSGGG